MQTKVCTKCKEIREISQFTKSIRKKDGVSNQCKICDLLYRERNKDKLLAYAKVYRESHREELVSYLRKDRIINGNKRKAAIREKKEKHPEIFKQYSQSDYTKNKDRYFSNNAIRRARCRNATPIFADKNKIREMYKLASKMTKETGVVYHVDHIIPLRGINVSGLHVEWNLQIIPAEENLKKHNKVSA